MRVEIWLKSNNDMCILDNVTHVSYSDDLQELLIHHKTWRLSLKLKDIESMVIRNEK